MNSLQLVRSFEHVLLLLDEAEYVAELVEKMRPYHAKLMEELAGIPARPDQQRAWNHVSELQKFLQGGAKDLRNTRPGQVFIELDRLRSATSEASPVARDTVLAELEKAVTRFFGEYETFVNSYSVAHATNLLIASAHLDDRIQLTRSVASAVVRSLRPADPPPTSEEAGVEIVLMAPTEYSVVIRKLTAISDLYGDLARLLAVDESGFPLKLSKLEAGSLWLKLVGESKIIELLTWAVQGWLRYLHRRFTEEGKLDAIPRQAAVVESVLGLSQKLRENGLGTERLDREIEISAVAIGQRLNRLLVGEPAVEVNGELIALEAGQRSRYLETVSRLQLESGGDDNGKERGVAGFEAGE